MSDLDLKLDWESIILDLCKKYEVDPEKYNEDDAFKETVAKILGFEDVKDFQTFPNPKAIVGGMGLPLKEGHLVLILDLFDDCCKVIKKRWIFDRDESVYINQIDNLLEYILGNNVPDEIAIATVLKMKSTYGFPCEQTDTWKNVMKKYGNLIGKF